MFGWFWDIYFLFVLIRWLCWLLSGLCVYVCWYYFYWVLWVIGDSVRLRLRVLFMWLLVFLDLILVFIVLVMLLDGLREMLILFDRVLVVYWLLCIGLLKLLLRILLISFNSVNCVNSMKGMNRMNSENKLGWCFMLCWFGLFCLCCSRGLIDDGFYLVGWWIFLLLSGWFRLMVVVLRVIYWYWVVFGECVFCEVDCDILLSYLLGMMEWVLMGLWVVRRRDVFVVIVVYLVGVLGSVFLWRVICIVVVFLLMMVCML